MNCSSRLILKNLAGDPVELSLADLFRPQNAEGLVSAGGPVDRLLVVRFELVSVRRRAGPIRPAARPARGRGGSRFGRCGLWLVVRRLVASCAPA